jgi:cell surface protein SprA
MRIRLPYFLTILFVGLCNEAIAQTTDSTKSKMSTFYNWKDVYLNRFNYKPSPVFSLTPKQINTTVLFNPAFSNFSITEKAAPSIDSKVPESLSFNEYSSIQNAMLRRSIVRDIERAQDGYTDYTGKRIRPLLETSKIFDRIFGDKLPEFMPNGFIQVKASHHRNRTDNPTVPIYMRDRSYFDFDQQIAINFNNLFNQQGAGQGMGGIGGQGGGLGGLGSQLPTDIPNNGRIQDLNNILRKPGEIREKVNMAGNFDTKSPFMFDNRMKINFKNEPEDILQAVEIGNISFPNRSQLIPGVQNLLGAKVALKFGKLDIMGLVAQQNSRTKSIVLNGGNQNRNFEIRADNYEENRHFFLSQFFRENYEGSLKSLPIITSGVIVTRVEAYVTNRTYSVETNRNILGLVDLGEGYPQNTKLTASPIAPKNLAGNQANNLDTDILLNRGFSREIDNVGDAMNKLSLTLGQDYEVLRGAKKLTEADFELNNELGYISLRTPLRNDEVLAVSFEYTYRGKAYRVGELTEDYVNRQENDAIVLKLLKSSNIRNQLDKPMWNLMMKNVYNLGQGQLKQEGFQLRVIYKNDKTGMDVPFLADVPGISTIPLLSLLGLDRLNYNNEIVGRQENSQGDGNFDFIEGVTVNARNGRVIFPVLEPFGEYLEKELSKDRVTENKQGFIDKYVFNDLYDKTLTDAQQNTLKNKFFLSGTFVAGSGDIALPLGASPTSVRVYSGGTELKQGTDYMVDQQLGTIRLTNPSLVNSGRTIRIDYEEADMFQTQIRRMFGLRLDYTFNRNLRLGATFQDLRENTPGFTTRTNIGNEPVNNTIWGLDLNYKKTGTGLTKLLDRLPGVQTKEPSAVMVNAEFAQLIPGVNTKRVNNSSMIDDFEYARNINDLSRQPNRWRLGSTPPQFQTETNNFDNTQLTKDYKYHFRRAKMSVYTVDMTTYFAGNQGGVGGIPTYLSEQARRNPFSANFNIQDILVGRSMPTFAEQVPTNILDISYFPSEPGMYNYNTKLKSNGHLDTAPEENFGSVMRGITFDADFDNSNVEYLEFWMMNIFDGELPVASETGGPVTNINGGKLLLQLGDVSEDVIPDSRFNFENGIRPDSLTNNINTNRVPYQTTAWGKAPNMQFMVDAFENDESIRKLQDVGFDGLSNAEEREFVNPNNPSQGIKPYLETIRNVITPEAFAKINNDPSKDDYRHFLDSTFTESTPFLERYKDYLGLENNSPFNTDRANNQTLFASTNNADKEDINQDNTINELEDFFEYEIDLRNDGSKGIAKTPYIVDEVQVGATSDRPATTWYLFRVPIKNYKRKYPSTKEDAFKSIRFMRVVATDFKEPAVFRFATMQLVSNQYRKYPYKINDSTANEYIETPLDTLTDQLTILKSTTVSIEENGCPPNDPNCSNKLYPYAVPPGFVRDINFAHQARMEFNEQSLSLSVEKLKPNDSRGVFKNTQLDLNMYKRLKMFVHMHSELGVKNTGMFIRLGTDLKNNYYEIEIPKLEATSSGERAPNLIWREENEIDVSLDLLREVKLERNRTFNSKEQFGNAYTVEKVEWGTVSGTEAPIPRTYNISVKGNPDLSKIMTIMIGVRNTDLTEEANYTIWTNELRAFGFDAQDKGSAGLLAVDLKLADLGTLMFAGNFRNFGFGSVQDKISNRSREDSYSFGGALNLALDKFLPMKWGLSIPFFVNYDRQVAVPGFNPLDPDIRLNRALDGNLNVYQQNLTRAMVSDMATTTGFNFMNVHKAKTGNNTRSNFYDIENFSFSYAQNRIYRSNILMANNDQSFTSAGVTYQYSPRVKPFEPFKNAAGLDSSIFKFLKPFNVNLIPTVISFRGYREQMMFRTLYRDEDLNTLDESNQNVLRYFYGNRSYDLQWNLTRSITVTYNAQMQAILDDVDQFTPTNQENIGFGRFSLGRAKNYNQKMKVAWRLPLQDIYLLDWITANATYDNRFIFKGVAFNQYNEENGKEYEFGNILENGRDFGVDGRVDLVKLYNKFGYLRRANQDSKPKRRYTRAPGDKLDRIEDEGKLAKAITRLLMSVRGVNGRFALTESTIMPGFLETPDVFGMKWGSWEPGLGFVLGGQSDKYHENAAKQDLLSKNIQQYNPIVKQRGYTFEYSTNIEPFKGFRMIIRGNIARNNDLSFVYQPGVENKDVKGQFDPAYEGDFMHFSPVRGGSFKMSFWSFKTSFKKINTSVASGYQYEPFDNLVNYRETALNLINDRNKASFDQIKQNEGISESDQLLDLNSQDVLIPAFFAAYTGRSVKELFEKKKFTRKGSNTFNPFLGLPMPNWQINYQGLEKLEGFRALFSSITLSHSFVSSYSVGNYTSSLMYDYRAIEMLSFRGDRGKGYNIGSEINAINNLFDPVYVMSSIVMEEKFGPFLGINFTTKGNFTGNFAWNKDRIAMLNLANAQVSETHGSDFIFGFGMKKNNVALPFRGADGNQIILKNDLIMRIDFSLRDLIVVQRKFESDAMIKTGARNLQIAPTVQYQFNKRISMSVYWKKNVNNPYATQTPYISNTEFGTTARFNLSD